MTRAFRILLALSLLAALPAAGAEGKALGKKSIVWDRKTLVKIHQGSYARIIRLTGGELLCCFEDYGKVWVNRSKDNGKTWSETAVEVAKAPSGNAANPELLQLANGWILLPYNERPDDGKHPFTIQIAVSKDHGRSWKHHSLAYTADVVGENGCWEPAAIQLPNGEVQLFFANENPYRQSAEQEITLLRSHDNGLTWSPPKAVSFRAGHRDGMPVPLILRDGKGIVIAIEDNGPTLMFAPTIIHTSLNDNWKQPFAGGDSPRRWRAIDLPVDKEWGGAPFIRQMPTGETILSFQSSVGREQPQMVVYVGDQNARNFVGRSVPFEVPTQSGGWWNSLFVKDDHTLTAVSQFGGIVWAIDGHIVEAHGGPEASQGREESH